MTRPDEELAPGDTGRLDPDERDLEAPTADAAEQAMSVKPVEGPAAGSPPPRLGFEVGEWDAMEQSIVIDIEDEYDR